MDGGLSGTRAEPRGAAAMPGGVASPGAAGGPPVTGGDASRDDAMAAACARRGALYRLACRLCWNEHDADDAVQNALVLAAGRRGQLADDGKLWPWLRAILVNQCREVLRRSARRRRLELTPRPLLAGAAEGGAGQADLARRELLERVRGLIAELPERQRTALVLRYLEGASCQEVAEMMRIRASTARVLVRNALEALRAALARQNPHWAEES